MRSVLLDLFYLLAVTLASPWILYRLVVTRGFRFVPERLGIGLARGAGGYVWLHGASVGEVTLLKPLIGMLERERPELPLVISSYTQTGRAAARAAYPRHRVVVFPLDFSLVVDRFLVRLAPRLVIIVESELWPNFLLRARRRAVPTAIVNGKMSAKSFALHRRTRVVARALQGVGVLAVQTEEHARRFRDLGVPASAIHVTGNMKYDLAAPPPHGDERAELRAALRYAADDVVVIGGSVHAGEDAAVLEAFTALARGPAGARAALVLAPRYPAEAPGVAALARAAGLDPVLKSAVDRGAPPPGRGGVLVVDTLGELGRLYAAADVAYVGGSMFYRGANKGGHNLMEPAVHGLPVLFGPYNVSFKETVLDLLAAEGGVMVHDAAELTGTLAKLVADPSARARMGEAARRVVQDARGASARNLALLNDLLAGNGRRLQPPAASPTMPRVRRDQRA